MITPFDPLHPQNLMVWLALFVLLVAIIYRVVKLVNTSQEHSKSVNSNKPASNTDRIDQLERLNKLRESGALSDAEYEVEKKKILS
ncbi:MAG: SHOCT domain-containing protein [Crocinitomicaceae bacterium]